MKLNDIIFRDLAMVARWAFQFTPCEPGTYTLSEVAKNKVGLFSVQEEKIDHNSLPSCAEWKDKKAREIVLNYESNGFPSKYEISLQSIFCVLRDFKELTEEIPAKEKTALCQMVKEVKPEGELLAVVKMPKGRTKQVVAAADEKSQHYQMRGLYIDKGGYIVATDGCTLNVCKVEMDVKDGFDGVLLPVKFAKNADGKTVEIYRNGGDITAVCRNEIATMEDKLRYPNWRVILKTSATEKGCVKVNSSDIKKSLPKKADEIVMRCNYGEITITENIEGRTTERKVKGEAGCCFEEAIPLKTLKNIMPDCTMMYARKTGDFFAFVWDGFISVALPLKREGEYKNLMEYNLIDGEEQKDLLDIFTSAPCNTTNTTTKESKKENPETTTDKPKPRKVAEVKPKTITPKAQTTASYAGAYIASALQNIASQIITSYAM